MRYKIGDILDGYELLTECGHGAFGSVFLAKNRTLDQKCALKILYKNGRQYKKELEGLKTYQEKCRHANLMRVDHVGENDECIFYTMDAADNLHPGKDYRPDTLGNRLKEQSRLEPEKILTMIHELLDGLNVMHSAGILHRDIKPDNIFWVNGHAMLGDIGLISNNLDASMAGTPGYLSPRVWKNRAYTPQDDLYALAMVMYCALNGNAPENYPIPGSMSLSDSAQQVMRIYNEVLNEKSNIKTVKDFQCLLTGSVNFHRQLPRKWILSACGIVLICATLCIVLFFLPGRKHTVTTRNMSETPVLSHRPEKIPTPVTVKDKPKPPTTPTPVIVKDQPKAQKAPATVKDQPKPRTVPAPITVKEQTPAPKIPPPAKKRSVPQKTGSSISVPARNNAGIQKTPEKENLSPGEVLLQYYKSLVEQLEKDQPVAETLRPYLRKMEAWYIKHQHDYESTPEPFEEKLREYKKIAESEMKKPAFKLRKGALELRLRRASGSERAMLLEQQRKDLEAENRVIQKNLDRLLQSYRSRYAAYQKLTPCQKAVFNYARRKFKADLLKQDLLVMRHHNYSPSKMAQLYEKWCATYRGLKYFEKKLLPVFDPAELD